MWMKGESFGLFEAVVELFGDEEQEEEGNQGTASDSPPGETTGRAAETGGDDGGEGEEEGLMAELPEVEQLRIEVRRVTD